VLSIALGYASYRYIESIQFSHKKIIVACMAVLFTGAFSLEYFNVNKMFYSKKTLLIANNTGIRQVPFYRQFRKDTCFVTSMAEYRKEPCLCIEEGKKNILIIGDSHMAQLSLSLREEFAKDNLHFLQATAPATLPTVRNYYIKKRNTRKLMDFIYKDFIPKNAGRIDGVILSANWAGQKRVKPDKLLYGIKEAVAYLKKYNIPTVIIGQTERYTVPYPVIAARAHHYKTDNAKFYLEEYTINVNTFLNANLKGSYINVFNENSFPPLSPKNVTYIRDQDHVSKYGADLLVAKIKKDAAWKSFFNELNQNAKH
jgi:hypothetical protein